MYNVNDKKRYVDEARRDGIKIVAKKYSIPLKSLRRWMLVGPERKKGNLFNPGGGRKIKDPEMEDKLYKWYLDEVNKNHYITAKDVKRKALSLTKNSDFIASKGWLEKFRKKYQLKLTKENELNQKKKK